MTTVTTTLHSKLNSLPVLVWSAPIQFEMLVILSVKPKQVNKKVKPIAQSSAAFNYIILLNYNLCRNHWPLTLIVTLSYYNAK